jgi:hypothetical protein
MAGSLLISIAPYYPSAFRGFFGACLPVTLGFPARVAGAWPVFCHPSVFMPMDFKIKWGQSNNSGEWGDLRVVAGWGVRSG